MLTHAEQYMLELINRTRLDPLGELALYNEKYTPTPEDLADPGFRDRRLSDLNDGIDAVRQMYIDAGLPPPDYLTGDARQPLAHNALLTEAARGHGQWLLENNVFSHTGENGSTIFDRIDATGYFAPGGSRSWGENLSWTGLSIGPLDLDAVIGDQHDNLFESPSHRLGMLRGISREVGISQEGGIFTAAGSDGILRDWHASMVVQKFASVGTQVFLTGVAFDDADGDGFYSIGEGVGGVGFAANGASTVSAAAGGYSLGLAPGAGITVTVTHGATQSRVLVDLSAGNVKLDVMYAAGAVRLLSSGDLTLLEGAGEAALLGVADLALTGHDAGGLLIGNRGANLITGGAGDDTLKGGAGDDTLVGGGGWNTALFDGLEADYLMAVEAGSGVVQLTDIRPGSPEGSNRLVDIQVLRFGDGSERVIGGTVAAEDDLVGVMEAGTVFGDVLANDSGPGLAVVAVNGQAAAVGVPIAGALGTLVLGADGQFTFAADSALPLRAGEVAEEVFAYTVASLGGVEASAALRVTVTGVNDPASIAGDRVGAVTEMDPAAAVAGGVLTVTDPDAGEDRFRPVDPADLHGSFGSFAFDPDSGVWSYTLDNSGAAVRALGAGETGVDSLTVTSLDGTASEVISVTVTGTGVRDQLMLAGQVAARGGAALEGAAVTFTPAEGALAADTTCDQGRFVLELPAGMVGHVDVLLDYATGHPPLQVGHALNALRIALGVPLGWGAPGAHDFIAADFTGDGRVGIDDVLGILRVALNISAPHQPRWVFVDSADPMDGVGRDTVAYATGIDIPLDPSGMGELSLTGILIGHVEGYLPG